MFRCFFFVAPLFLLGLGSCSGPVTPTEPVEPEPIRPDLSSKTPDDVSGGPTAPPERDVFRGEQAVPLTAMRIEGLEGSHVQNVQLTESGEVWVGLPGDPPDDPDISRVQLRADWSLEIRHVDGQTTVFHTLDHKTGEIGLGEDEQWDVPTHIHCFLLRPQLAHCTTSWGHTPPWDSYFIVEEDGTIVARAGKDGPSAPIARIVPSPQGELEAFQALFLFLDQATCNGHGDDAHDINF